MTIRNAFLAAGSVVALSALAGSALAAGSVQTTANASVSVVSPTTLTKTQDMAFGTVIRPSTGTLGTVPANGTQELKFGGQFDISSTTTAQPYTGTLTVTVNYN